MTGKTGIYGEKIAQKRQFSTVLEISENVNYY